MSKSNGHDTRGRVVVTGIGVICPVGQDRENSWETLMAGQSGIGHISSFDVEGYETRIAGEVADFDPAPILGTKKSRRLDRFAQRRL